MEVNPTKKIWKPKFGPNGPKSGPKLGFSSFPQVYFAIFWVPSQTPCLNFTLETHKFMNSSGKVCGGIIAQQHSAVASGGALAPQKFCQVAKVFFVVIQVF